MQKPWVFVTIGMPLAALLALTLLIGFAGGVLAAMKIGRSPRQEGGEASV